MMCLLGLGLRLRKETICKAWAFGQFPRTDKTVSRMKNPPVATGPRGQRQISVRIVYSIAGGSLGSEDGLLPVAVRMKR